MRVLLFDLHVSAIGYCHTSKMAAQSYSQRPGHKIAPNTGADATKFFTLPTKSWKVVGD